ncbi:hypothetical protein GGH99_002721 [Coemansia sp. RSA 1285]|nr:hypothetical protein EV177_003080 [Coemansia sp. RSA 1804]KAJ2689946.1 hypothetical protein GGH99_002721 [Coemansia sp. RSA 1285]
MSLSQETHPPSSESLGKRNSSSPGTSVRRRSQVDKENDQGREYEHDASFDISDDMAMDPDDSLMDSFLSTHSRELSDFASQDYVDSPGAQSTGSQAFSDSDFRVKRILDANVADFRVLAGAGASRTPVPARLGAFDADAADRDEPLSAPMPRRVRNYMSPRQRARAIESPLARGSDGASNSSPLRGSPASRSHQAPKKAHLISSASSSFIATRSIFEQQSQSQPQPQQPRTRSKSPTVASSSELGVQYDVGGAAGNYESAQDNNDNEYDSDDSQELYGTSPQGPKPQTEGTAGLNLLYSSSESEYPDPDDFLAPRSQQQLYDSEEEEEREVAQSLGKRRRTQDSDPGYGDEAVPVLPSEDSSQPATTARRSDAGGSDINSKGVPGLLKQRAKAASWSSPKRIKLSAEPAHLRRSLDREREMFDRKTLQPRVLEKEADSQTTKMATITVPDTTTTCGGLQRSRLLLEKPQVADDTHGDVLTPTTAVQRDSPRDSTVKTDVIQAPALDTISEGDADGDGDDGDSVGQTSDITLPDFGETEGPRGTFAAVAEDADGNESSEPESVELEPELELEPEVSADSSSNAGLGEELSKVAAIQADEADEGADSIRLDSSDVDDKETDKLSSDELDVEDRSRNDEANGDGDDDSDKAADTEDWHPAEEVLDNADNSENSSVWRPESSEIPNVSRQSAQAATPSPLKPAALPPAPATASTIRQPASMLASVAKRRSSSKMVAAAAPRSQPTPDRQRRLSHSRPASMCQRLVRLHELTKSIRDDSGAEADGDGDGDGDAQSGLLSLVDSGRSSGMPSAPPSPQRMATFSGAMRVFGERAPVVSDADRLRYMCRVKALIQDTEVTAREALRILYFFTGDWAGARRYIVAGCTLAPTEPSSGGPCMWTAREDEALLQGTNAARVEGLRQRKGNVEVYRRLQFLNTFHGPAAQ